MKKYLGLQSPLLPAFLTELEVQDMKWEETRTRTMDNLNAGDISEILTDHISEGDRDALAEDMKSGDVRDWEHAGSILFAACKSYAEYEADMSIDESLRAKFFEYQKRKRKYSVR